MKEPLFLQQAAVDFCKNSINARPGDHVTIGLNRMALVPSSLMTYLLPLLMLIPDVITGEINA
ncbi:MAG TPA: hypothetical protein ENG90_05800 [Gammaproteobacteria bacterium]|nr:hypothetical protein [Gammaproteobacteria bacterium]HDH15973.1 hypothetical protein [Gammaproteobacteria bacterium]HDZ79509.1 hypothetical protein [Gammaproteobacteria bacterium]